jgi:hypothetical protein
MTFLWFFATVYLFTSMLNYVLHGQTVLDDLIDMLDGDTRDFVSTKRMFGDFCVRGAYISCMFLTATRFMESI